MNLPLSDDGQVVLDTLVVDVLISLKVGHLDLAGRASGSLGKGAKGSLDGSRLYSREKRKRMNSEHTNIFGRDLRRTRRHITVYTIKRSIPSRFGK